MNNGDHITGEIKRIQHGTLYFKPEYGLQFSNFRFKLFDVASNLSVWPNLSTPGRVRLGSQTNISWEFVRNLYWNLQIYENFDSRPPVNAPRNDFGVTTSLGWKF